MMTLISAWATFGLLMSTSNAMTELVLSASAIAVAAWSGTVPVLPAFDLRPGRAVSLPGVKARPVAELGQNSPGILPRWSGVKLLLSRSAAPAGMIGRM